MVGFEGFTQRAARATSVHALASCLLEEAGGVVGAPLVGMYLFRDDADPEVWVRNVPDAVVEQYEAVGRDHDPVLADVTRAHSPAAASLREMIVYAREHALPASYCELLDRYARHSPGLHCVQAPLLADGVIAGTLNFARTDDRAFGGEELRAAAAISLHVSTRLVALRGLARGIHPSWREVLTARGVEVAELAARGLTTHEVGRMLGVSANTVKKHLRLVYEQLGVGTRAELASVLLAPRDDATAR